MLIVLVLFMTVLLRAGIVVAVVYLMLPKTRACPRCGDELVLMHHSFLRRLVPPLEHRWCLRCGWTGVTRRAAGAAPQSRVIKRAARS
jgi:ribosomal protein S27AE